MTKRSYTSDFLKLIFFREALNIIHRRGLYDSAFASKLVSMLSSFSFTSLQVHNIKIRNQFIQKLQQDYDGKYRILRHIALLR